MKKYPKVLADVAVLKEVLDYLYRQAEQAEEQAAHYEEVLKQDKEAGETCSWHEESLAENKAKAEAYVRMAEKLAR